DAGVLRLTDRGRALALDERVMYPDGLPEDPAFRVHVGPVATGKTVSEDPEIFARLGRLVRKTLGVEMEAAGIEHAAAWLSPRSLLVKAVSDYGDREKDDAFRGFAARASAEFLLAFLARHLEPVTADTQQPASRGGGAGEAHERRITSPRDSFLERV